MTKYLNCSNNIIAKAKTKQRKKKQGTYYERHHVVPVSLGGTNSPDNLVLLTAKEHFLVHKLLFKHYMLEGNTKQQHSMALAFHRLSKQTYNGVERKFTAKSYALVKRAISKAMTGEGNPMYGVTSRMKGKKVTSVSNIEANKAAGIAKRTHTSKFNWINAITDEVVTQLDIYELAAKYPTLDTRKLGDVSRGTTDRLSHGNWSIVGTDTRNKYIRTISTKLVDFYNYQTGVIHLNTTIDYMLATYNLPYTELRNIVTGTNLMGSIYGWCSKHVYDKKFDLYQFTNIRVFTLWLELTDEQVTGTVTELAKLTGNKTSTIRQIIQRGQSNTTTSRKPNINRWLYLKEIT